MNLDRAKVLLPRRVNRVLFPTISFTTLDGFVKTNIKREIEIFLKHLLLNDNDKLICLEETIALIGENPKLIFFKASQPAKTKKNSTEPQSVQEKMVK